MHGQNGQGRFGFIVTLAIFSLGIFLAVKIVPARVSGYQFSESLREEARYAAVHSEDAETVARIMDTATEMDIPLDRDDVKIRRTRKEVVVSASYEQPIDLKFTTYTYKFKVEQKSPLF